MKYEIFKHRLILLFEMPRIGHIILNVSDFDQSEEFYDRILLKIGFETDYREKSNDWSAKSYKLREHNVWIKSELSQISLPFVRNVGLDHLAFFVDSADFVDEIFHDLTVMGAKITRAPRHYPEYSPQYYAIYFRDPDGIPLEVAFK